jgi:REP element-mobilizing transposase RayT
MSTKDKFLNPRGVYFVTFAVINWIDLFIRNEYRNIMLDSWRYCCKNKGMDLYAWVIMTSHIHMIMGSQQDNPEDVMRDMKRWTSIKLKEAIRNHPRESRMDWMLQLMEEAGKQNSNNNEFQLWRQDNHPIELYTPEVTGQKLEYLHYNPVEVGFTDLPENYLYSSARDYYTKRKGLIEVKLLDPALKFY